jgi:hypothetical protein
MDEGTPLGGLESKDKAEPSHGLHVVLSSLWGRGHLAHRLRIRFPEDEGVRRPKQSNQPRRLTGPARKGSGHGLTTLGAVSAVPATLPRPRGAVPRPPDGRLGASATTRRPRASQAHVPSWDSERALTHGVKTTHPCFVPRTARARTTAAPRTTRLVALTLWQDRRHLWQAKQATLHLRHNDRVKKGAPRRSILYPFPPPLSLSCHRDRERGYFERDPSPRRKRAPSPPTDQRFEGWPLGRFRQPPQSTRALSPPTDQRFEGWPLGRVRQPPQSTRAPRPPLVRGSKAGPLGGVRQPPQATRAPRPLLIRGS